MGATAEKILKESTSGAVSQTYSLLQAPGCNEELKVIATAEKILKESTSGAVSQTYSFLQTATSSQMHTRADLANSEVINIVKKLARDQHSAALAQLASRIAVVVRYGAKD